MSSKPLTNCAERYAGSGNGVVTIGAVKSWSSAWVALRWWWLLALAERWRGQDTMMMVTKWWQLSTLAQ